MGKDSLFPLKRWNFEYSRKKFNVPQTVLNMTGILKSTASYKLKFSVNMLIKPEQKVQSPPAPAPKARQCLESTGTSPCLFCLLCLLSCFGHPSPTTVSADRSFLYQKGSNQKVRKTPNCFSWVRRNLQLKQKNARCLCPQRVITHILHRPTNSFKCACVFYLHSFLMKILLNWRQLSIH